MRYAIFSDVHANLEALQAVLRDARRLGAQRFLCLGDIVGYGPDPGRCLALVRETASIILTGNHEWMLLNREGLERFNPYARQALLWTRQRLSAAEIDYLQTLPLTARTGGFHLVHAAPRRPADWRYLLTLHDAEENFAHFAGRICFFGHSHVPAIVLKEGRECRLFAKEESLAIVPGRRYLVNVGSVGQPRDGNIKACYALYDIVEKNLQIRRVAYDVTAVQEKILAAGLPEYLAWRLERGW